MTSVPLQLFDSSYFPAKDQAEAWHEHIRWYLDCAPLCRESFSIRSRAWQIRDCLFGDVRSDDMICRLTDRHINSLMPVIGIRIYRNGGSRGQIGGDYFEFLPAAIHILDFSVERTGIDLDVDFSVAYIPHSAVGYCPGIHPKVTSIDMNSPSGRVLAAGLVPLLTYPERATPHELAGIRNQLVSLIEPIFRAPSDPDGTRYAYIQARKRAIKRYVQNRLRDPELDWKHICAEFNISRATLFRAFEEEGGIQNFIRMQRIDRIFDALAQINSKQTTIRAMAQAWGFDDASYFHRLFRQRYKIKPGDVYDMQPFTNGTSTAADIQIPFEAARHV